MLYIWLICACGVYFAPAAATHVYAGNWNAQRHLSLFPTIRDGTDRPDAGSVSDATVCDDCATWSRLARVQGWSSEYPGISALQVKNKINTSNHDNLIYICVCDNNQAPAQSEPGVITSMQVNHDCVWEFITMLTWNGTFRVDALFYFLFAFNPHAARFQSWSERQHLLPRLCPADPGCLGVARGAHTATQWTSQTRWLVAPGGRTSRSRCLVYRARLPSRHIAHQRVWNLGRSCPQHGWRHSGVFGPDQNFTSGLDGKSARCAGRVDHWAGPGNTKFQFIRIYYRQGRPVFVC